MGQPKRLHFGVIISSFDNTIQNDIWSGIVDYANQCGAHLTAYLAAYQTTTYDTASNFETCYNMIQNSRFLDGIILFSGFITNIMGKEAFEAYAARIAKLLPVVSISYALPGAPSILTDNAGGMYQAVRHLIEVHGKKNIAFVKGPDGHPEAEDRLNGYKRALLEKGIQEDARYIFPGDFSRDSGQAAVETMLQMPNLPIDAIAASNDETAIGIINALKRHGLMVPADIAVTGFDDDRDSSMFVPSFSTIRQDFKRMGAAGAEALKDIVAGKQPDPITYVPANFMVRQSCGCMERVCADYTPLNIQALDCDTTLNDYIYCALFNLFTKEVPDSWAGEWAALLFAAVREQPFDKNKFRKAFCDSMIIYTQYSDNMMIWNEALHLLSAGVEHLRNEIEDVQAIHSTLINASAFVHDIIAKKGKNREFALHDSRQILRRISSNLVLIFDIDVLAAELMRWLPDTDIHAAVVGLYPHSIQSNDPEGNRDINRLIGFIGNKPINLSAKNDSPIRLFDYTSSDLFDFEAKRRDVLLIPLFFKDEEFGIMLMPFNRSIPGDTYESLRVNISTAIKGAELINEIEYRNGLLNAVNDAATILLKSSIDEFESQLTNAMGVVARKINVGHMFIWQNTADGDAREARLMYEWYDAAENKPADGTQRRIVYQNGFQAWREALSAGECVSGSMSESAVKNGYGPSVTGFHAFLIAPILYNDLFWGFIGFNSPNQPRRYSDNDEMVLRSVSKLVANALLRQDMARNLQTSLEQVVEASRAKSDFLSNMSHEMRTPMNAIIGMTAIGKKAESADQKNRALNKIAEASSHLLGVINDVLDMSKIEANKLDLNRVTFDFRLMLQKVVTVIRFKLDEKHQAFSVNIDPELPRFMIGDDQRLAQVITNLLSNAVKFTHAGGSISLRVFIVGFTDDTYDIGVEVKDNGIGIPVDKQEKIFEAFEQAESGTSRVYGGTGLGLVISKRIVELMQGTIRVESELGEGASFMFTVKLHTAKHPTDSAGATSANRMSIPAQASSDGGRGITDLLNDNFDTAYAQEEQALNTENLFMGKKMLLAEDIDINREILLAVLEETSIEVDCAANGREALEMVKANPVKYDIIFMDLQMPMMDGLEATRAIRALPQMKDNAVPIVAMTANVFKSDIEHCLDAGMNDHLGKPLDIQRVMETLRKYL